MPDNGLNELVDNYFSMFNDMTNETKIETFKLGMIEVYKKLVELAENENDAAQFFMNVLSIICTLDVKNLSKKRYEDIICSLGGDIVGYKQFYKSVESFNKDKNSISQHVKVLNDLDDDTKNELIKAVGCLLTYDVKSVDNSVKEKFLNFMIAVRT